MKKTNYILITVIIILLAGCYTVLEHPDVESKDENGNISYNHVDYGNDCTKCHTNAHSDYTYDYDRYNQYYTRSSENPAAGPERWIGYYQVPWWYSPAVNVTRYGGGGGNPSGNVNNSNNNSNNTTRGTSTPEIRNVGSSRDNSPVSMPTPVIIKDSRSASGSGSAATPTNNSGSTGRSSGESRPASTTDSSTKKPEDKSSTTKPSTDRSSDRGSTGNTNNNNNSNNSNSSGNSNNNTDANKRNSGSTRGRN